MNQDIHRRGVGHPGPETSDGLTHRECEVLALAAEGYSNRLMGVELDITDRTVARHLTNIFHKINVTNRTEAALTCSNTESRPPLRHQGDSLVRSMTSVSD